MNTEQYRAIQKAEYHEQQAAEARHAAAEYGQSNRAHQPAANVSNLKAHSGGMSASNAVRPWRRQQPVRQAQYPAQAPAQKSVTKADIDDLKATAIKAAAKALADLKPAKPKKTVVHRCPGGSTLSKVEKAQGQQLLTGHGGTTPPAARPQLRQFNTFVETPAAGHQADQVGFSIRDICRASVGL
jgi:hypothetical protein